MSRSQVNDATVVAPLSQRIKTNLMKMFNMDQNISPNPSLGGPTTDAAPTDPVEDMSKPDNVPPVINQEFGVSLESYYTRFELHQYSPDELISKKGFKIYEKMYTDDQIHLAITGLKLMRLSSGYEINEASQDPQDIEIADFVADVLSKVEGGVNDMLFNLLGALEMGWSINEKIWAYYEQGPYQGKARLKALKSKNPQWFNPTVDDFNNLTGIAMIGPPAYGRKLPADKFIIYSPMKRYENIFGYSRIRALYDWWWIKQVTRRALGVFLEKYGHPFPVGTYPINMQKDNRDALLRTLQQLKVASAITMPDGCKVDFIEASKNGAEAFLHTIEKCDQQIVKVIMGQTLSSGTSMAHAGSGQGQMGGHGAGASSSQMDVLNMYLEYIGNHLAQNPMAILIKEIVDYNFSGVVNYPTFRFKAISEKDLSSSVPIFIQAAQIGLVNAGQEDEERIREVLQFPSVQGKNTLRPNRYLNKPKPIAVKPRDINPLDLPWAGYRPPTPSGPGKAANYAEDAAVPFKLARKRTKYESHVDFAESYNTMEKVGVQELSADAAKVVRKAVEKVKVLAKKIGNDTNKIRRLEMPYRGELASTIRDGLQAVAKRSMRQAKGELADVRKFADLNNMEPKEVLDFIKDKSFTMSGDIDDEVLKRIKQAMYNGVKAGKSYKDIVYDIEKQVAPYIDLTQSEDLSGARLETAIRTGVAEAYNEARKSIFMDPDLEGFVLAFQYSAILDDRTTEWCDSQEQGGMDGRIFKVSNPIWDDWTPPVWYNCRSVLVPITQVDEWDGEESEEPTIEPPAGFK